MKSSKLFTPGPLNTSLEVKQAMLQDWGSRDQQFGYKIASIQASLLKLAGVTKPVFEAILMQGSGTFALEAALGTLMPPKGKLLALVNGAYGRRLIQMAEVLGIEAVKVELPENQAFCIQDVKAALKENEAISMVSMVHCETSSGLMNPTTEIGALLQSKEIPFMVDAMSSFGGVPIQLEKDGIDILISSANKCIQGVPGFGFVLLRQELLKQSEGQARSLSLDLYAQGKGFEQNGQFRFTPPTHALAAFEQALKELEIEGGVEARAKRYQANNSVLLAGMQQLGFEPYLDKTNRGYIITTFLYPKSPSFDFNRFYDLLATKNQLIYPGKLTQAACFRIGNIGDLYPEDIRFLLTCITEVCVEMGFFASVGPHS